MDASQGSLRPCRLLGVLLGVSLSGCTSLTLNMASTRYLSPESNSFHLEFAEQGINRVVLVPDASATPPQTNSPSFSNRDVQSTLAMGFRLVNRTELFGSYSFGGVPLIGIKQQIAGPKYRDSKGGDFSLAVTGAFGYIDQGSSSLSGAWGYDRKLKAFDGGLILGCRLSKSILLYGGPYITHYDVQGTITQPVPGGTVYPYSGNGLMKGVHFGLELGRLPPSF